MDPTTLTSIDSILKNAASIIPDLTVMIRGFAMLAGVVLMGYAILQAKVAQESRQQKTTYRRAAVIAFSAVILVNLDPALSLFSWSLVGEETAKQVSILGYADTSASNGTAAVALGLIGSILAFVQFVGLLAFIRGWFVLNSIGKRPDATLAKGTTHIIGGVMAINVVIVAQITAWTFGIQALSALLKNFT